MDPQAPQPTGSSTVPTEGVPLSPEQREIVREEEVILAQVQARLTVLRGERHLRGDAALRLRELRDEAATAHEEDLPALLDQLHVVRSVEERRSAAAPLPESKSPYFAHFRLRDGDGDEARDYLLGHLPLLDSLSGVRLLDWRNAPLSQLYYRYREGDDYEAELPGRRVEGMVEVRRALVIIDGQLRVIQAPQGRLERTPQGWLCRDEADLPQLSGGAGSAQRGLGLGVGRAERARVDVSALLDPVQFDIVNESGTGPLLVLGSAGSGKTTVALHRLASLHHQAPEAFAQKKLGVVVPELGLSRLVGRLLAPLGLGQVEVSTFTQLSRGELQRQWPELPAHVRDDAPPLVARLKRHRALFELLGDWVKEAGRPRKLETLRRDLLMDRRFLREVMARAVALGSPLPQGALEETIQRTTRQIAQTSEAAYRGMDVDRLTAIDGARLDEGTPEELAQTLDTEDLPLLLELGRLTQPHGGVRRRAHLLLDEAQELCALELSGLRHLLGKEPSVTVAGDDVQRTGQGEFDGWDLLLEDLGVPHAVRRTLAVSYRCPLPIARLAQEVLGRLAPGVAPSGGHPGAPVGMHRFPHAGGQILAVQDALADLVLREPQASVAVLTRTAASANRWAQALAHLPEARLVREGDFSFEPGIDVCEVAEAKGLEFDYVLLPDGDTVSYPEDDDSRRALHVAVTRAIHQLWIAHVGTPSALLPVSLRVALGQAMPAPAHTLSKTLN